MPHIHTQPDQHDMTVSAYILLQEDDEWKCLMHFHRKMDKLMQIGGHIELNQTPWQAVADEIEEESGFSFEDLSVLQIFSDTPEKWGNIVHPLPVAMNTHNVGDEHYHSDLCYGFVANRRPDRSTGEGESDDLRWLSLYDLERLAESGEALKDVHHIYAFILAHINDYIQVPTAKFSLLKPDSPSVSYKRGRPSDSR